MIKGRSGRKVVVLSVALVGILSLGVGLAMGPKLLKTESASARTSKTSSGNKAAPEKTSDADQVVVPLGEFLVNLDDETRVRYLRAELSVQMARPQEKKKSGGHGGGEAKAELPAEDLAVARDRVVAVLSAAGFGELRSTAGRDKLKARLLARLEEALPQHDISEVLVTSFVMQ